MRLTSAKVTNFRLLSNIEIDFDESEVTSIVGKNNSGKTSFSSLFKKMIITNKLEIDDYSLSCRKIFYECFTQYRDGKKSNKKELVESAIKNFPVIELVLDFKYEQGANINNIRPFLTALDDSRTISVKISFSPTNTNELLNSILKSIKDENVEENTIYQYIKDKKNSFKIRVMPNTDKFTPKELKTSDLESLFHLHFVDAQRQLDDSNIRSGSRLSKIFQGHFNFISNNKDEETKDLSDSVVNANDEINKKLKEFFKVFTESFKKFGFPGLDGQTLEVNSELEVEKLLENNVKFYYGHEEGMLAENYNGLGYSNLIFIISEILSYKYVNDSNKKDLSLIFIEEPEAHMHPQMQDVFIKNINNFLKDQDFNVQIIISTHSSHIISSSEFNTIRYFDKERYTNIKDLLKFSENMNAKEETLKFLKKYLTLGKCDLFFSDKAILFEGAVERVLMPLFIKKMNENGTVSTVNKYISFVEVGGAYMHKFEDLLNFINVDSLLITDLDPVDDDRKKVLGAILDEHGSSNNCLTKWLPEKGRVKDLLSCTDTDKTKKRIRVTYQTKENSKVGRSFEESFIIRNYKYIFLNKDEFKSISSILSPFEKETDILDNSHEIHSFIDRNKKKMEFAFEIIMATDQTWEIPGYIEEGLQWLLEEQ